MPIRLPQVQVPGRLFAAVYDRSLAPVEHAGLGDLRGRVLAGVAGDVLELGAGTGANLGHYPAGAGRLVLTEPDRHMRARLEARVAASGRTAEVVGAAADALPVADASFDAVVATLVLCTVDDPAAALAEVRRVLRPGGRLVLVEHVRSHRPGVARLQRAARPLWQAIARGCRLDRDTPALLAAAGFAVDGLERLELPSSPRVTREAIAGAVPVRPA